MSETNNKIKELYFGCKLDTVEIADSIGLTKQRVSNILRANYKKEYKDEKERRKLENKEKHEQQKIEGVQNKRLEKRNEEFDWYRITGECLRMQHEQDVMLMSEGSKITNRAMVEICASAYEYTKSKKSLKYKGSEESRPIGLPKYLKLNIQS